MLRWELAIVEQRCRLTSKHTLEVTFQASKSGYGYQSIDQDFLANNRAEIGKIAL